MRSRPRGFGRLAQGEAASGWVSISSAEKGEKLEALGLLLCRLLAAYQEKDSDEYGLIVRIFSDQYTVSVSASEKSVLPKPSQSISSSSLQFVHDPVVIRKGVQKVKGYSVNLTETCDGEGLNLITDVEVKPATAADNAFVQPAIERTQEVVGQVSDVSMDGAYHAACNSAYAEKEDMPAIKKISNSITVGYKADRDV